MMSITSKQENRIIIRYLSLTLIELVIVIFIIALLAAMLAPALNYARNKAREVVCINNLRQVASAFKLYYREYGDYPYPTQWLEDFTPIYPYVNNLEIFRSPFSGNSALESLSELNGGTDYYVFAHSMSDMEKYNANQGGGNQLDGYGLDISNPSQTVQDLISAKGDDFFVYENDYAWSDGWIHAVSIIDLHHEKSYGVTEFWFLDKNHKIIKSLDLFPSLD